MDPVSIALLATSVGGGLLGGLGKGKEQKLSKDQLELQRFLATLEAPNKRLDTSVRASRIANAQPVSASWGGPGSGMRGGTVKFSGGKSQPLDPRTKELANDVLLQELEQQGLRSVDGGQVRAEAPGLANHLEFGNKMTGGDLNIDALLEQIAGRVSSTRSRDINRGGPPKLTK